MSFLFRENSFFNSSNQLKENLILIHIGENTQGKFIHGNPIKVSITGSSKEG